MALQSHSVGSRDTALLWTLALSAGLHILAFTLLPNIKWEEMKKPIALEIRLAVPQKAPEPVPEAIPEPAPKPEPPPPPPPKPKPKPKVVEPKPQPKVEHVPQPVAEPPPVQPAPEPPSPPAVITAPPKLETPPTFTALPPPPPKPSESVGPTPADLDAARNQYKGLLEQEIAKYKQYPRIAQMRGWQGEAIVELQIDQNGKLESVKIKTSSGHEVLDKTAIEMVRKTVAGAAPPQVLLGHASTYIIPVAFHLQN